MSELAFVERGEGRPVVLVHGMASSAREWEGVAAELAAHARVIAYDRRGYGGSDAPEPYERTTVEEQAEDAARLIRELDAAPAVLGGRDLGALVCLDLIKRHRHLVRGAAVVDPALYQFSPAATEALSDERLVLEQALREGGPADAVESWLEPRRAGAARVAQARRDAAAFFADFAGLPTWPILRRELRAFDLPLVVLVTPIAPPHVQEAARALADLVPGATLDTAEELTARLRALLSA